jgi:hypothetical protein
MKLTLSEFSKQKVTLRFRLSDVDKVSYRLDHAGYKHFVQPVDIQEYMEISADVFVTDEDMIVITCHLFQVSQRRSMVDKEILLMLRRLDSSDYLALTINPKLVEIEW